MRADDVPTSEESSMTITDQHHDSRPTPRVYSIRPVDKVQGYYSKKPFATNGMHQEKAENRPKQKKRNPPPPTARPGARTKEKAKH
jgi:hypothetical protein